MDAIARMARAAGITPSTVTQILRAEIDLPPLDRLRGFAQALDGVSLVELIDAVVRDGANRENYQSRSTRNVELREAMAEAHIILAQE